MKKTFKEIGGTSFYDTVIESTVNELKVNFEWEMETSNGDVFTVYDWKEYRSLSGNEVVEWHIGGHSKRVTEQAKREIESVRVTG
mgnify:CR=1 FL=1